MDLRRMELAAALANGNGSIAAAEGLASGTATFPPLPHLTF